LATLSTSHKWLVVARCEYNMSTGRIRRIRPYLPFLIILLLALHVAFLAPAIVSVIFGDTGSYLLSQAALASVQIAFFCLFFYFIVIPFADTLRQPEARQLDLLLSAPISSSDLLLGEYVGQIPFYGIFITLFAAVFAAVLGPLGMGPAQNLIIITIFVLMSLSAFWIGVVGSAVLKTRLERFAGGRDIGKAVAMMLPLPMMVVLYAAMGGGLLGFLSNPEGEFVQNILAILPSSWGAKVVIDFAANPGNLGAISLSSLARLGGIVAFFFGSLWVGLRVSKRAYSLQEASLSTSIAGPDGLFYRLIRKIGGGRSFGILLASLFKEYGRRLENISNVGYMIGILVVASVFLPSGEGPPAFAIMRSLFIYPIVTVMVTADVTVQGKESLFIYKKVPHGTSTFLKVLIARGYMLLIPLIGFASLAMCLMCPQMGAGISLVIAGILVIMACADVIVVFGLFLVNPAFTQKSPKFWMNVVIVILLHIGLFVVAFLLLVEEGRAPGPVQGLPSVLGIITLLLWLASGAFLALGIWKLNSVE
jgi:hypothetical protein